MAAIKRHLARYTSMGKHKTAIHCLLMACPRATRDNAFWPRLLFRQWIDRLLVHTRSFSRRQNAAHRVQTKRST